jgi:predicted NBD/HSP70 family sugar kinase
MAHTVGVLAMEHIAVGLVTNNTLAAPVRFYPSGAATAGALQALPAQQIADAMCTEIGALLAGAPVEAIGVGFPGVIHDGVVEESPNLQQMKGFDLARALSAAFGDGVRILILNDADAVAAGIAAIRGHLDALIRVWTLGSGVGYGRYPLVAGPGEGGHMVVTLDPKETLCGCGGAGHLEGIVGHRSMRLRFLDMEPEEVFENAAAGDARCTAFVQMWHRALAAATATSIHVDGPGRFYISGLNAHVVDIGLLERYLHEMVRMSPLLESAFEVVTTSDEVAIIGAAVSAKQAPATAASASVLRERPAG